MILFLTSKISGSSDDLMTIFQQRKIEAFRFNSDLFHCYRFSCADNRFVIKDPCGRSIKSEDVQIVICYKALLAHYNYADFEAEYQESDWLKSWMNTLYCGLVKNADQYHKLRLWQPLEERFSKLWQMDVAKKYFTVPAYHIFWGEHSLPSHKMIAKPLNGYPIHAGNNLFAKIVDQADLDRRYPWFTQEIADGNRDATVVYINGNIHCYQFATERGELTDWRVTQGTERNQWVVWNAGREFEQKIDAYMRELGLKYGRLDFIIGGKEPQFLEVNPCGQFGWLDDEKLTLHNEVVDAILDPSSAIQL